MPGNGMGLRLNVIPAENHAAIVTTGIREYEQHL